MRRISPASIPALLVVTLISLSIILFIRSDDYRDASTLNMDRLAETSWRIERMRDILDAILIRTELAEKHGIEPGLQQEQVQFLIANAVALANYRDLSAVISSDKFQLAQTFPAITTTIDGLIQTGDYSAAFPLAANMNRELQSWGVQLSADQADLQAKTVSIDDQASENRLLYLLATMSLLSLLFLLWLRSSRRANQATAIRSLAVLHAHVVQSRLTSIRLFFEYIVEPALAGTKQQQMALAEETVRDLEKIQQELRSLSHPTQLLTPSATLQTVIDDLHLEHRNVTYCGTEEASRASLSGPSLSATIDELIRNAETAPPAISGVPTSVRITATVTSNILRRRTLRIVVADDAVGMSPDVYRNATSPFFTTKSGRHNGLGLSAAEQLIKSMNGTLTIRSAPGSGTAISLAIPYRASPADAPAISTGRDARLSNHLVSRR